MTPESNAAEVTLTSNQNADVLAVNRQIAEQRRLCAIVHKPIEATRRDRVLHRHGEVVLGIRFFRFNNSQAFEVQHG